MLNHVTEHFEKYITETAIQEEILHDKPYKLVDPKAIDDYGKEILLEAKKDGEMDYDLV